MAFSTIGNLVKSVQPTAALPAQTPVPQETANGVAAVQPTGAGADTQSAANGSGGGTTSGQGSAEQQAQTVKPRRVMPQSTRPSRAEPASLLGAQANSQDYFTSPDTNALIVQSKGIAQTKAFTQPVQDRPDRVDRYAPPDPLPTAPILKDKGSTTKVSQQTRSED